jgi:hypothetical protein
MTIFTRVAAVAGLLLTAVAAQAAQRFDVKFNFRTPAGEHAAGKYSAELRDQTAGATKVIFLRNLETGKTVMMIPIAPIEKLQADGPAQLKFPSPPGCGPSFFQIVSDQRTCDGVGQSRKGLLRRRP